MAHSVDQNPASGDEEAEPLIAEIIAKLSQVAHSFDAENSENWQWLADHSADPQAIDDLRDMSLLSMRVVDAIGQLQPVNGATISARFHIPKGTVSKVTRRLIARELVQTESLPQNKKEILFRLTPLGAEVFQLNHAFDALMLRGFNQFFQRYTLDELRFLVRILSDATHTSFLTLASQESQTNAAGD
jgi:DNA-binding MarR family transcriptional regulator